MNMVKDRLGLPIFNLGFFHPTIFVIN